MSDDPELYLRDLEAAANAVGSIPADYNALRELLNSLPRPTAPDIRSAGSPSVQNASGAGGLTGQALSIQSDTPIGTQSGVGLGVEQPPTIGLRNYLEDARLVSAPFTPVSLLGGGSVTISRDWFAVFTIGATGVATCTGGKIFDVGDRQSNPLSTSLMFTRLAGWTGAGSATLHVKHIAAVPSFDPTVLPYVVFSCVIHKSVLQTQLFNNASGVAIRLAFRNAADNATLAESTPLDFLNMGDGEYRRLAVALSTASWAGVDVRARIEIALTTTGAAAGLGDFSVGIGDPQIELAPTQSPQLFIPEPAAAQGIVYAQDGDYAYAVKRFNDGAPPDIGSRGRLALAITSTSEGAVTWGGGSSHDVRLRRTATNVLRFDNNSTGGAVMEWYARAAPTTPAAGLGRLYYSSADKLFHSLDDAGVDTAMGGGGGGPATQVSRDAAAASGDYVARIRLNTDTTYRAFLGLTTGDAGSLEFGPGGVAARDVRLTRTNTGDLTLDSNGGSTRSVLFVSSTSGQRSALAAQVAGDSAARAVLWGDATVAGLELGPGSATRDLRVYRSGAKILTVDDTAGGNVTVNVLGTLQQSGTGVSVAGHGAADHADLTRRIWLPAQQAMTDGGTFANIGATPELTRVVALADAATQGAFWTFNVPADYGSGAISVQPVWAPGATDAVAHTVRWSLTAKTNGAGATITAAGTTTAFTGASAARTVNVVVYDTNTSTGVTPGANDTFRVELRRIGADAADTYVGVVNLLGLIVSYTANQ